MCPGRCTEIVTGCISPLHQAIVQLDISIKLILCMLIIYLHIMYVATYVHAYMHM